MFPVLIILVTMNSFNICTQHGTRHSKQSCFSCTDMNFAFKFKNAMQYVVRIVRFAYLLYFGWQKTLIRIKKMGLRLFS